MERKQIGQAAGGGVDVGGGFVARGITGIVVDRGKTHSTHVFGSGGGGLAADGTGIASPVHVSSVTTVHDRFHLKDASGVEHAFQLTDLDVSLAEGNEVTVVSLRKKGAKSGRYVAVRNHTTRQTYLDNPWISKAFAPSRLLYWALILPTGLLCITLQQGGDKTLGVIPPLAAVGVFLGFQWRGRRRATAFKQLDFEKLRR